MSDKKNMFEKDSHYVMFIPPSWIVCGTVDEVGDDHLLLKDAVWNETVKEGAGVFDLCHKLDTSERAWPLPDGTVVSKRDVLMAAPAENSFRPLIGSAAKSKIKRA